MTADWAKVWIALLQSLFAAAAGAWTYWIFVKQRMIARRVEFEASCRFLGPQLGDYIAEITLQFTNRGLVRNEIRELQLRVRGIKKDEVLTEYKAESDRLTVSFPVEITDEKNLLAEMEYMFIEPGITQNFRYLAKVSSKISFIRVRSQFLYATGVEHDVMRVFEVKVAEPTSD